MCVGKTRTKRRNREQKTPHTHTYTQTRTCPKAHTHARTRTCVHALSLIILMGMWRERAAGTRGRGRGQRRSGGGSQRTGGAQIKISWGALCGGWRTAGPRAPQQASPVRHPRQVEHSTEACTEKVGGPGPGGGEGAGWRRDGFCVLARRQRRNRKNEVPPAHSNTHVTQSTYTRTHPRPVHTLYSCVWACGGSGWRGHGAGTGREGGEGGCRGTQRGPRVGAQTSNPLSQAPRHAPGAPHQAPRVGPPSYRTSRPRLFHERIGVLGHGQ